MQNIYLMPFTAKSVLLYHALTDKGRIIAGFLDNDKAIDGKQYEGCEITSPEIPMEVRKTALVVLCEPQHYNSNEAQLIKLGFMDFNKIDYELLLNDAVHFLLDINKKAFCDIVPEQADELNQMFAAVIQATTKMLIDKNNINILNVVDILITEKCNLRCKYCANLMQYFTNPMHMTTEQIFRDIDLIFSKSDWIKYLYIFGGEAFLHPQLAQILEYAHKYRNQYGAMWTITNGAVIPSEATLQAMEDYALHVTISDYGDHSRNIDKLIEKFEIHHIRFQRVQTRWFNVQQLVDSEGRDANEVFSKCGEDCVTIRNGLLYRCPFLVHAETLNAIPYSEYNHLDISREDITSSDIQQFLLKPADYARPVPPGCPVPPARPVPPGCAYCSGYNFAINHEIPVAEQISAPLPYKKFTV